MNVTVFVGDCGEYLSIEAKNFAKDAYLLTSSNVDEFLDNNKNNITVYTSAADLPKITKSRCVLYEVLDKADTIYYKPPAQWLNCSYTYNLYDPQTTTEYFLFLINRTKNNVVGLELSKYSKVPYLNSVDQRKSLERCLWMSGCSITKGIGVNDNQRYASLIAKEYFNEQFVDLSEAGSSLEFQADQILRSDIKNKDIVIWGLTSEYRAVYWDHEKQKPMSITPHNSDHRTTNKANDIVDETRLYKAVILTNQVTNFCQKIGAKLIMVPIICSEHLQLLLHKNPCYYQLAYHPSFIDLGNDHSHPGPKQHQFYAEQIKKILNDHKIL